jgi:hypothetical protein
MKKLLSVEELRNQLAAAFEAGVDYAGEPLYAPDFEEWHDSIYGGPDCE